MIPHPLPGTRDLNLPPEGAEALRTVLGILDDAMIPIDSFLAAELDERLTELWQSPDDGPVRTIPISVEEADLLLAGLRYTEAMSTELPWYEMVIEAVQFVGDALLDLWTDEEWLAWREWRGP
jgi:hypothetical protein